MAPTQPDAQQRQGLVHKALAVRMTRPMHKKAMTHLAAYDAVQTWARTVRVLDASAAAYGRAWGLVATHHYQMWDALTIAVCADHAIGTLYSGNAGSLRRPLGVKVVNAFAELATR